MSGLEVRISGEKSDDPQAIGNMLSAMGRLLEAATESACGNPNAIAWKVASLHFVCDGCDRKRPSAHKRWVKEKGLDFCPTCQADGTMTRTLAQ